jgi:glycosyltransferase involved in cell wall biosynthesis
MPLISIITITYNAQDFLKSTIDSIRNQTSNDYEYIIIDGFSVDNTLNIAKENAELISVLISEKDNGLYDAMNKGLKAATGSYVWFVNAGDEIAETDAIEKLEGLIKIHHPDVIYSDTKIINQKGEDLGLRTELTPHKLVKDISWMDFNKGMLICHQSFIVKREIAPEYISNNLSADIDWEIKCLKRAQKVIAYPGFLSKYLEGGISNKQLFRSWKDRFLVLEKHFGVFNNIINHLKIILRPGSLKFLRVLKYVKN